MSCSIHLSIIATWVGLAVVSADALAESGDVPGRKKRTVPPAPVVVQNYEVRGPYPASRKRVAAVAPPEVVAEEYGWRGPYIGAVGGAGFGVVVGDNFRSGRLIVGIEAEVTSGSKQQGIHTAATEASSNWAASARARAGLLVMPRLFVYAMSGVGLVDFNFKDRGTGWSSNEALTGLQLGLGVEWKVFKDVSLRLDYLHTSLSEYHVGPANRGYTIDPSVDALQLGVMVRF
jgi:opacity protein-like surface antigen